MATAFTYFFMLSLVFRGYLTGSAVPPWDFMGGGHVETFRWYSDGSFLNPPSWFPYAWFGLPEHQLVQNGGWVIPIGVVAETLGWTPRNAALVQLFYVWLGGMGAFLLARMLRWNLPISFLVGFVYLFSIMNFSNAQHSAMLRASALLPLVIAAFLPRWLLKSPYFSILSAVIWWQLIVSSYPGNLVTIGICLLAVVVISIVHLNNKTRLRYGLCVVVGLVGGVLLAAPRWLPVLLDRESFPVVRENTAALRWELLPTFVSTFDLESLPNDVTMRSLWLAPICLAALVFLRRANRVGLTSASFILFSLLAMSELPGISQLKDLIPGLRLSTFAISDWRPVLILAAAVLMGSVLHDTWSKRPFSSKQVAARSVVLLAAFSLLFGLEYLRDAGAIDSAALYLMALVAAAAFIYALWAGRDALAQGVVAAGLALVTFASVLLIATSVDRTWQTDRELSEAYVYGSRFADLKERVSWPMPSRPARWYIDFPPLNYGEATGDARYNRFWVTGEPSAAGAHNVKFSSTYQRIIEGFDMGDSSLINFLSTSGRQLIVPGDLASTMRIDLSECAADKSQCNQSALPVEVLQVDFDRQRESFRVISDVDFRLVQNEPAHFGWQGQICGLSDSDSSCKTISSTPAVNQALRAWDLPAGRYIFRTEFVTPGEHIRWWLFGIGVLLVLGYPLVTALWRLDKEVESS